MAGEDESNALPVEKTHQLKSEGPAKSGWLAYAKDRLKTGIKSQQQKSIWKSTWMPIGEPTIENLRTEFQEMISDFDPDSREHPRFRYVVVGSAGKKQTYMLQFIMKTELKAEIYRSTIFSSDWILSIRIGDIPIKIKFEDLTGQEEYDRLRPLGYIDASVILICFTARSSEEQDDVRHKWVPEVRHFCPKRPIILVSMEPVEDDVVDLDDVTATELAINLAREVSPMAYVHCDTEAGENLWQVLEAASMAALLNTPLKRKRPWHRKFGSTAGAESENDSSKPVTSPSEITWNAVCATCAPLFDVRTRETYIDHHEQWEDLHKAANSKCYICLRIRSHLEKVVAQDQSIKQEGLMPLRCEIDGSYSIGELARLTFTSRTKQGARYPYDFIAIQDEESSKFLPAKPLHNNTNSDGSVSQAKVWLDNCLKHHDSCGEEERSKFIPTRLIRIDRGKTDIAATLCDGASLRSNTKYLTLSHCWGNADFLTLTQDSMSQFKASIPLSHPKFNRCFLDALQFTFKLGFRYLWIDSLCIIQKMPNDDDWKLEFPRMGDVYRNAVCNLAATAFVDGAQGIFVERDGSAMMPAKVAFETILPMNKHYFVVENEVWTERVESSPLLQRAWVIPEQILSPRTIHFGSHQIFWECQKMFCCEMWPERFPSTLAKTLKNRTSVLRPSDELSEFSQWSAVVQAYSRALLTNPNDKFPAISGVAKVLQTRRKDQYIAGMWKKDLYLYLLWRIKSDSTDSTAPVQYRAPSWSWASVNAEVKFALSEEKEIGDHRMLCDILDVSVTTLTGDETGPLSGGYLRLSGPLRPFDFEQIKRITHYNTTEHVLDFKHATSLRVSLSLKITMFLDNPQFHRATALLGKSLDLENPKNTYLMPIAEADSVYSREKSPKVDVYFLILVRGDEGKGRWKYRRIGMAVASACDGEAYAKMFFGHYPDVDEKVQDGLHAPGGYAVTIL